jgi:hypothetical protein
MHSPLLFNACMLLQRYGVMMDQAMGVVMMVMV